MVVVVVEVVVVEVVVVMVVVVEVVVVVVVVMIITTIIIIIFRTFVPRTFPIKCRPMARFFSQTRGKRTTPFPLWYCFCLQERTFHPTIFATGSEKGDVQTGRHRVNKGILFLFVDSAIEFLSHSQA